jgi:hypothetical protein
MNFKFAGVTFADCHSAGLSPSASCFSNAAISQGAIIAPQAFALHIGSSVDLVA